jgi:hypothetical protein
MLKNRTLILGAGAFQKSLWECSSKPSIGFCVDGVRGNKPKEQVNLTLRETLPTELVNRFRATPVVLPQLIEIDYRRMLEQTAEGVPAYLRKTFLRLGYERISDAVVYRQGCRFVEELLIDTMIEERSLLQVVDNIVHEPEMIVLPGKETKEPQEG